MNIFHIINSIGAGGSETFLYNLINYDQKNKHYIIVLSKKGFFFSKFKKLNNVEIFFLGNNFLIFLKLYKFFKEKKPSLINSWMYRSHVFASLMKIFFRFNLIFHFRHVGITNKHSFFKKFLIKSSSYFINYFADEIIFNSYFSKKNHIKNGINNKNITVIHNCFYENFKNTNSPKLSKKKNEIVLGMLSRKNFIKDHKTLIDAFLELAKKRKNIRLLLKGSELNKLEIPSFLKNKINILDASTSVEKFYSMIDIHVLSSFGESFPNVVAEAMVRKIPSICSNVGDANLIVLNKNFIFQPENYNQLVSKIDKLINIKDNYPYRWNLIKKNSKKKILDKFNSKKNFSRFENLWKKNFNKDKKGLLVVPSLNGGGAERVISNLSNDIYLKNYSIDILVFGKKSKYDYKINNNINTIYLNKNRSLFAFITLFKYFCNRKYRFILSTKLEANILSIIAKILSFSSTKLFVRETNTPSEILKYEFNIKNLFLVHLRRIYFFSNYVICNSHGVKENLVNLNINSERIIILPNSLNISNIKRLSKKYIFKFKRPYFIYAGRHTKQKNLEMLIESFDIFCKTNGQYDLRIYTNNHSIKSLSKFVNFMKYRKNIKIEAYKDNIYPYIKKSKALLMTSNWEGLSNITLEALQLNKKVLLTDCKSGPREIKKFGYNILLSRPNYSLGYVKKIKLLIKMNKINNTKVNNKYTKYYNNKLDYLLSLV